MRSERIPALRLSPPRVYVGPRADRAIAGERGVLLGSRRPAWIDVVEFEPRPDASLRVLIDWRFTARPPWDVVGLSLSAAELRRSARRLLRELVPGDVVLTARGARFHSGRMWVAAELVSEKKKGRRGRP